MRFLSYTFRLWVTAAILIVATGPLLAQDAQLGGRVTDPSGAVIPGTNIVITNVNTGAQRRAASNDEGYYAIPRLLPGTYRLAVQKEGFKQLTRDGILLQVGDRITLDVTMEIGTASESVTITAEIPLLRTEDAEQGLVIDNRRIMELPQYSRDPLAFAQLAPNVNGSSSSAGYGSNFRIDGGRTNQAEYFQDGIPVTTGYQHNIPASTPSKEALAEFKVLTSGLSAEYGRLSGGAVVLVTRSGTNEFHGSAYEFFKNDKLNANGWNANRLNRPKAIFHDNVFGFTFGGPVTLPKLYNGRDRTFFFLNYEGMRHVAGSNANQASVPTELERAGDFSQSLYHGGKPVEIFDPSTGRLVNGQITRDPFPGNRIPQARFDPLAKVYLGYYPMPNQAPQVLTNNVNNYVYNSATPSTSNRWTGRLDQNWSTSNTTHFTISQYSYSTTTPRAFSKLQAVGVTSSEAYTTSLEHNWTLTPSTIVTFRGGVVRSKNFSGSTVDADATGWPLAQNVINLLGGTNTGRVPNISASGITALGGGSLGDIRDTTYTGSISLQKMWGKHTLKAGWEHRRYLSNEMSGGSFSTYSEALVTAQSPAMASVNGLALAGYMLGLATGGSGSQMAGPASLQTYHGAYLQDDIKLTPKLTVNAGLRWDLEPPRTERFDRQSYWDRNYTWGMKPDTTWSWSQVEQAIGKTLPQPIW
ncbi:MAG: TonB-dependent receptor, partial [Bryobacterales bacterium]|nr:TonB-dependent receptor [Bryobacterales bacterium]